MKITRETVTEYVAKTFPNDPAAANAATVDIVLSTHKAATDHLFQRYPADRARSLLPTIEAMSVAAGNGVRQSPEQVARAVDVLVNFIDTTAARVGEAYPGRTPSQLSNSADAVALRFAHVFAEGREPEADKVAAAVAGLPPLRLPPTEAETTQFLVKAGMSAQERIAAARKVATLSADERMQVVPVDFVPPMNARELPPQSAKADAGGSPELSDYAKMFPENQRGAVQRLLTVHGIDAVRAMSALHLKNEIAAYQDMNTRATRAVGNVVHMAPLLDRPLTPQERVSMGYELAAFKRDGDHARATHVESLLAADNAKRAAHEQAAPPSKPQTPQERIAAHRAAQK